MTTEPDETVELRTEPGLIEGTSRLTTIIRKPNETTRIEYHVDDASGRMGFGRLESIGFMEWPEMNDNEFRDNVIVGGTDRIGGYLTPSVERPPRRWLTVLFVLAFAYAIWSVYGCASQPYPLTSGAHVSPIPSGKFVVWSNHPGVESYLMGIIVQTGQPVVERSRLTKVFEEQKVRLSHTSDGDILRVGKLVGATQVLFAQAEIVDKSAYFTVDRRTSVTLRAVDVQSGQVLWVGSARFLESMAVPDQAVVALTYWALVRALCDGIWEEPSRWTEGGCKNAHAQVKTMESRQAEKPEPTIWREMRGMEGR